MTRLLQDETQTHDSKGLTEERDLAHEADMRALMRQQLRDNISPEEAAEECAEIEARAAWMEGADLDDGEDLMGDPDEYWEEEPEVPPEPPPTEDQLAAQDSMWGVTIEEMKNG